MELHSETAAKKMWYYLRAVLFMLRVKSVISKRKLIMDVSIFMNRSKFIGKSISNLLPHKHHHPHHSHHSIKNPSLSSDYDFANYCTNTLSLHAKKYSGHNNKRRRRNYFACLNAPLVDEGGGREDQEADIRTPLRLEHSSREFCELTKRASPFDARVSDFCATVLEGEGSTGNGGVDCEAEEFIRRFYEQLKKQREVGLLEYPQTQTQTQSDESGEISEC